MGFFRRRKRKKSQLDRILQENPEICEDGTAEDESDPKKMQAYIAGCCREILLSGIPAKRLKKKSRNTVSYPVI